MSFQEAIEEYGESFHYVLNFQNKPFAVDRTLAANLLVKAKWMKHYKGDMVLFFDGLEGSGKSTHVRQIAKLLDPKFNHNHITYDKAECMRLYKTLPDWSVIVLDESDIGVTRKDTMTKENKEFASFMRQSRQAHKILLLCGPSIYDIDSYIAEHRVTFLIHHYFSKGLHPGYFKFYNRKDINNLFIHEKKSRTYNRSPRFIGRFSKGETCDMEQYELKKKAAFERFYTNISAEAPVTREQAELDYKRARAVEYKNVYRRSKISITAYCDVLGISKTSFKKWNELAGVDIKEVKAKATDPNNEEPMPPTPDYFLEDTKQPKKVVEERVKVLTLPGLTRPTERAEPITIKIQ